MTRRSRSIVAMVTALISLWGTSLSASAPPSAGTISVEFDSSQGYESPKPSFANAVAEALAAKGLTVLDDPGHAAYVAEIKLSRTDVGTGSAKVRSGGIALSPGGYGSVGAGVVLPFSTGETRLVPLQRVRLEIRIRKRGEDGMVWNGTAVTVRAGGTPKGADGVVATDLSEALLRIYPAIPEDVLTVP